MEELEEKIIFLIETVRQLERRVTSLEKLIKDVNVTSDDESVIVTGALNIPDIPKVTLSEEEILEVYNNNPDVLFNSAVKVSVTQESLLNKDAILLEKTKSKIASYWVVATEDNNYWLLPKGNLKINSYNYETVKRLFECDRYQADIDSEFLLIQMAKVSLNQNRIQWQLLEPGRLKFIYKNEYQEEENLSVEVKTERAANQERTNVTQNTSSTGESVHNTVNEADSERLLINLYNNKYESLLTLGTVVSETGIPVENLSLLINNQAVFGKNITGEYCIFSVKQAMVYLVPRRDIDISQYIEKIQHFFECRDYQQGISNKFKLIKPATVLPLNSTGIKGDNWVMPGKEIWQLQNTGILQFE